MNISNSLGFVTKMSTTIQENQKFDIHIKEPSLLDLKELVLSGKVSLEEAVHSFERSLILDAMTINHNNLTHSAKMLGISRRMIKYKYDQLVNKRQHAQVI